MEPGTTLERKRKMDSTDTTLNNSDSVFIYIKNILMTDANLCNFIRYMDYGKIKKDASSGKVFWTTEKSVLNDSNKVNNTQLVRFVQKIDTKFLNELSNYNSYMRDHYDMSNRILNVLFNNTRGIKNVEKYDNINEEVKRIIGMMINIDCKYKITGSSLTALDFVGKNPNVTNTEYVFYRNCILMNITKMIFVGDKCYLLAIVDSSHHIYVSNKILMNIYNKDETDHKTVFKEIVVKLFNVIKNVSVYFLNTSISQYYNNIIVSPLIKQIYNDCDFNFDERSSLQSFKNFTFCDNLDRNEYIKQNIEKIIKSTVLNYINSRYFIDSIDIGRVIREMRENIVKAHKNLVDQAYTNGIRLNTIFQEAGWEYFDVKNHARNIYFNKDHIYIQKAINKIPRKAILYTDDVRSYTDSYNSHGRDVVTRIIKDEYINTFHEDTNIRVNTLYLDIIDGVLLCEGSHPNVSSMKVCMGDLKGKVSFTNLDKDAVLDLLKKCEELLDFINYTSSYNSYGKTYFCREKYSKDYEGLDTTATSLDNSNNKNNIIDLSVVESDDLEELDEESSSSDTSDTSDTSLEFEEVTNENDFEEQG